MKILSNVLFIISFATSSQVMANDTLYKPSSIGEASGFYVAKGDYEDIRTYNWNAKNIRHWNIKSGNLKIEQKFKNGRLEILSIKKANANSVVELLYVASAGSLKLQSAVVRKPHVFFYSGLLKNQVIKNEMCIAKPKFTSELDQLNKKFNAEVLQANLSNTIIDQSCKRGSSEYALIEESLLDVMAPENDFMLCLGRESTAEKLSAGYNISKGSVQEELKLIGLKYNLQSSRFMAQPQTVKSKIMCSVEKSPKPAQCNENGAIVFNFASSAKNALTLEGVKELTIHESLHDLGIAREGVVDNLINVCFGRPLDPLKARSESAKELGFTMGSGHIVPTSHTNSINVAEAEKAEIKIPRTLAETAIPNPPPAELNRPFTNAEAEVRNYAANPEGAAKAAYTQSLNSTSGIINFAKTAVASFTTPALAIPVQTRGLASVSAGSGRAYFAKSSGKNSDKYVIKEEILIGANNKDSVGDSAVAKSTVSNGSQASVRAAATTRADIGGANESVAAASSGSSGSSASSGVGVGAGSASIRSSGGGSRSPASARAPASSSRSGSAANSMSLNDIQKTLVNYDTAVRKLADPGFRRVLKENKILIINMADKIVFDPGVPKGQAAAVFLDTGSSFVRGNKK